MFNLWEPLNIHALPTSSETKLATEAIESLELQLQNALVVLLQAQHAVETLQQQIKERRAWIASVRRVAHDVLSLIFLEVCQVDWSAPLILGHVCHVWRESIIAYPRAWSYFQLQDEQANELRSLFISRSAPCSLHLRLPAHFNSSTFDLFDSVTERIQCLRLDLEQAWNLRDHLFPAIERLNIEGYEYAPSPVQEYGFIFSDALFPCLRSLNAGTLLDSITWDTPPFPNFVPLQVLSVTARDTNVWRNIVGCCSESLTSLAVSLYPPATNLPIPGQKTIALPRLESLRITCIAQFLPSRGSIGARTPALQTYSEYSTRHTWVGPIHEDTQTVTSLESNFDVDLHKFPQVRQMSLSRPTLRNVVERLVKSPALCPNLDTIVDDLSNFDGLLRVKNLLSARNKQTGGNIQFRGPDDDGVILYKHPRDRNCGYNMPCAHRR